MALRNRLGNRRPDLPEDEGGRGSRRQQNRNEDDDDEDNDNDDDINGRRNNRNGAHGGDNNADDRDENDGRNHDDDDDRENLVSSERDSNTRSRNSNREDDSTNSEKNRSKSFTSRFRRNKKPEEKPSEEIELSTKGGRFADEKNSASRNISRGTDRGKSGSEELDDSTSNNNISSSVVSQNKDVSNQLETDLASTPLRVLEPIRADPVTQLKTRRKKMERLTAEYMPEIHIIGSIVSGAGIINEISDGATCRWKIDCGSGWEHLGGEQFGQTQVSYPRFSIKEAVPFNHPLDLHFAEPGIQTWGSPRLMLQCYRLDIHGRRILAGYGFIHLPTTKGLHRLEVNLWRPTGTSSEEMDSKYLGRVPALLTHEPIYDSAWDERCRLVTVPAGSVFLELFVMTRFLNKHNTDVK